MNGYCGRLIIGRYQAAVENQKIGATVEGSKLLSHPRNLTVPTPS